MAQDLIAIFNDHELELLISGLPEIDVDDLRANTEYTGYTPASPVIRHFWEVRQGFSKGVRTLCLQRILCSKACAPARGALPVAFMIRPSGCSAPQTATRCTTHWRACCAWLPCPCFPDLHPRVQRTAAHDTV